MAVTIDVASDSALLAVAEKLERQNEILSNSTITIKGDPGEQGAPGITPHVGENGHWYIGDEDTGISAGFGASAYDLAKNNGFVGTEEEWLASLKGEQDAMVDVKKVEYNFTQNYFVNKDGVVSSGNNYAYSEPITVVKGEILSFTAKGSGANIAMIATCDADGGNIVPKIICIDSEVREYSYRAEEDGFVIVSFGYKYEHTLLSYGVESNKVLREDLNETQAVISALDETTKVTEEKIDELTFARKVEYTFTQGQFVNASGIMVSANNVAYSSPVAVNAGEAVVLHAYVKNTVAAISTCDESGGHIVPMVIGRSENDIHDDYFYRVEEDGYVVLSFAYNPYQPTKFTNSVMIYGEKSNLVLHDEIEKIKAEDTIFTRCKEQVENIYAGCDYHRHKTKTKNFALLMVSDLHGDTQRLRNAIDLLNGCDAIDAGIVLGDMEAGAPSTNITTYVAEMNKATKPFFAAMGNHDASQDDTTGTILTTEATARYLKQINTADIYTDRGYGYKDFDTHKIRLIILNQHDYPTDKVDGKWVFWGKTIYLQAQIDWFISALASTPSDYTVVVACHHVQNIENNDAINNLHADCKTRNLGGLYYDMGYLSEDVIGEIVDAFKRKATLSKTYNYTVQGSVTGLSVNADFSAREQSLFAVHIGGHTHSQFIGNKIGFTDQLVYVNDTSYGARHAGGWTEFSLFPRNNSGKSQDLITVLCVDTENQMINLVRVGSNMTIYMENYDVLNVPFGS